MLGEIETGKSVNNNADMTMGNMNKQSNSAYATAPVQTGAYATAQVQTGAYATAQVQAGAYALAPEQEASEMAVSVNQAQNTVTQDDASQQKQTEEEIIIDEAIPKFKPDRDAILTAGAINEEFQNRKKKVSIAMVCGSAALLLAIGTFFLVSTTGNTTQRNTNEVTVIEDDEVKTPLASDVSGFTNEEREAIQCAQSSLSYVPYSKVALIRELTNEYNGYSEEVATSAVEYMENAGLVVWQDEATEWALELLDGSGSSKMEIIDMLTSDYSAFTQEEAEYAMNYIEENNLVDWKEQAKRSAEAYLDAGLDMDRDDMLYQLVDYSGFTQEEALYAIEQVGL